MIKTVGKDDIGYNTAILSRIAADAIEFLNSHLEGSQRIVTPHAGNTYIIIQVDEGLNRPLAMGVTPPPL